MRIAVRLDDITPDMDWGRFETVKGLLDEAGIRPLAGIVPDSHDPNLHIDEAREDFWEYIAGLVNDDGWSAAQHGYQHVYTTAAGGMFPLNHFSEFAGVPYEKQLEMIEKGHRILASHGIETDIFMTPAHSYDRNTLRALRECGFRYVTDGFGRGPYMRDGLIFLPIPFRTAESFIRPDGYTTMVLHLNTMTEGDMDVLKKRLAAYTEKAYKSGRTAAYFINYSDLLNVHYIKRKPMQNSDEYMLAVVKHSLVSIRKH
jgi:predicted deacetylase